MTSSMHINVWFLCFHTVTCLKPRLGWVACAVRSSLNCSTSALWILSVLCVMPCFHAQPCHKHHQVFPLKSVYIRRSFSWFNVFRSLFLYWQLQHIIFFFSSDLLHFDLLTAYTNVLRGRKALICSMLMSTPFITPFSSFPSISFHSLSLQDSFMQKKKIKNCLLNFTIICSSFSVSFN